MYRVVTEGFGKIMLNTGVQRANKYVHCLMIPAKLKVMYPDTCM